MELGLEGKVVLVTGGSAGLGEALVRLLADEGASVAFCARDESRLAALAGELTSATKRVTGIRADVRQPEDLARFVTTAVDRFGRVDALVNNAGTAGGGRFEDHVEDTWRADMELKLMAAVTASRLVLPHLRSVGGGAILNTLSVWGKAPRAASSPSSVTRAAGLALTKVLANEFGRDNIRTNAVLVGLIRADQWRRAAQRRGIDEEALYAGLVDEYEIPLGRMGSAPDFARLAAFLISPAAAYINGAAINLDGGLCPVP